MSRGKFIVEPSKMFLTVFILTQNAPLYIVLAKISRAKIPRKTVGIYDVQTVD